VTTEEVSGSTTNTVTKDEERSGDLRSLPELGVEGSFKAFKVWRPAAGVARRHVVEPYLNYTFIPEPALTPDAIYRFDTVDELSEAHWIDFGVRNKIQTKREGRAYDLVDVNVFARYLVEPGEGQDAVEAVGVDAELRPAPWFSLDMDGEYAIGDGHVNEINGRAKVTGSSYWTARAEYRYRHEDSSLLSGGVGLTPDPGWGFDVYSRYEFEETRVEEIGLSVQRNLDCMVIRTGLDVLPGYERSDGEQQDTEWRVGLEMWLTAFPEMGISAR
jgi:hypothetical protein